MNYRKKIVILGGGTAGWLSALFLKKNFIDCEIIVVESSSVGVLGAGEGSTPQIVDFFDAIGIPLSDLVKHAGATIKNGIKFTNWNNDNQHYYHSFIDRENIDPFKCVNYNGYPVLAVDSISKKNDIDYINFSAKLCESNKVKFIKHNNISSFNNPIQNYNNFGKFSIHFNARKLALFLKDIGQQRGIDVIDGLFQNVVCNDSGYIKELVLINQEDNDPIKIPCDFVIDCSGFHKLLIDKVYNSPWKSYSELLPVDKAIPFFIDYVDGEDIPPYTESIAMKYGWMWKIPVEGRYGCGYVFDSSLISIDQAKEEVKHFLGKDVTFPTTFSFSAGYFEKPWINNCVALGLSSGFIEPLEATSIWTTIHSLNIFRCHIDGFFAKDNSESDIDLYNKKVCQLNDEIFNFVYLHYLSRRNDTAFWNKFKDPIKHPEPIKKYLKYSSEWLPWDNNFEFGKFFTGHSYLQVAYGIGVIEHHVFSKMIESFNIDEQVLHIKQEDHQQNINTSFFENHNTFLKYLIQ